MWLKCFAVVSMASIAVVCSAAFIWFCLHLFANFVSYRCVHGCFVMVNLLFFILITLVELLQLCLCFGVFLVVVIFSFVTPFRYDWQRIIQEACNPAARSVPSPQVRTYMDRLINILLSVLPYALFPPMI